MNTFIVIGWTFLLIAAAMRDYTATNYLKDGLLMAGIVFAVWGIFTLPRSTP